MNAGARVRMLSTLFLLPLSECNRPRDSLVIFVLQPRIGGNLSETWQVISAGTLKFVAVNICPLIREVKQYPQLETGVRESDLNRVRLRLIERFGKVRVFIDIEDAPDLVVIEVCITTPLRLEVSGSLYRDGPLHDRLGNTSAPDDLNVYEADLFLTSEPIKVRGLRLLSLTDDQDPRPGVYDRSAASEAIRHLLCDLRARGARRRRSLPVECRGLHRNAPAGIRVRDSLLGEA